MAPLPEVVPPTHGPLTIPNALSVLRLLGVPLFLYLLLGAHNDAWAVGVLFAAGFTDWLDGKLARVLDQGSRLGELLDPAVDRLYMVAIPIGLAVAGVLPWWTVIVLVGRDLALAGTAPFLRSRGITALPVLYIGKAATFALMSAMPMILAGRLDNWFGTVMHPLGWAFLWWGVGMYLWTLVLYWVQTIMVIRELPRR